MRNKLLAGLLIAAGFLSNGYCEEPRQSKLEQILEEKEQFIRKHPFILEKKINYEIVARRGICDAKGNAFISTETELSGNNAVSTFTLDGKIAHFLLGGARKLKKVSEVYFNSERFTTSRYVYSNPSSHKKEQQALNYDFSKTLIDELSVIQYVRSLDLNKLGIGRENSQKFKAIGIDPTIEGKRYPISIYKSNKITSVTTPAGEFTDFWNIKIIQGKELERKMSVYYTKDAAKIPIYIKTNLFGVLSRFYLKSVER